VQCCVTSPPYYALRDYGIDGQIGLEETPAAYIAKMVAVFAEVRRVLRDDGTLWLNIGDSYAGSSQSGGTNSISGNGKSQPHCVKPKGVKPKGVKPKDLLGIPWRVAFALRDDGWYLRQDIVWSKPNGMPESVTDRCTKAHEYVFLLTKSERYFYDRLAIADRPKPSSIARLGQDVESQEGSSRAHGGRKTMKAVKFGGNKLAASGQTRIASGNEWDAASLANKRSVWHIPVGGYREAHFATFPPELPATCLKAGTSAKGCCAACGAPWERVTESERVPTRSGDGSKVHGANIRVNVSRDANHKSEWDGKKSVTHPVHHATEAGNRDPQRHITQTRTTGWQPTCDCGAETVPCLALDPFNGAGTTGLVAVKGLGLRYIGFELNPKYADMARRRIARGFSEAPKQAAAVDGQRSLFEEPAA
jgi:DNA modification methylase